MAFTQGGMMSRTRLDRTSGQLTLSTKPKDGRRGSASHERRPGERRSVKDRIIRATTVDANDCWVWAKATDKDGYGKLTLAAVPGDWSQGVRYMRAHRVAYEEWVGLIPDGLVIDHQCDNPACCNPDHLTLNTHVGNVMRGNGVPARNARKAVCLRGHDDWRSYEYRGKVWRACRTCQRERARHPHEFQEAA